MSICRLRRSALSTLWYAGNGAREISLKQWLSNSEKDYLRSLLIKYKGQHFFDGERSQSRQQDLIQKNEAPWAA